MDSIITQVQDLAEKADDKGRLDIQTALRDLQLRLETPKDSMMRLLNSVSEELVAFLLRYTYYIVYNLPWSLFCRTCSS